MILTLKYKLITVLLIFLISTEFIKAQIDIKVINIENNQPIINASVFDKLNNYLGVTNEDGIFKVLDTKKYERIIIKIPGFEEKIVATGKLNKSVYLFRKGLKLKSDLKATKILKKMWDNRNLNSPDHLDSYEFDSYVKFSIEAPSDSVSYIPNPKTKLDSLNNKFKSLLDKSMLFLGERTMTYKYDKKFGRKAIVTAYKAGGFSDPELFNATITLSLVNEIPKILTPKELQHNTSLLVDSIDLNGRKTYIIYTFKGKSQSENYRSLTVFIDAKSYALVKLIGNTSKISDIYYEITYAENNGIWYAENEYIQTKLLSKNFIEKMNKLLPKSLFFFTRLSTTATIESNFLNFKSPIVFDPKEFNGYEYAISKTINTDKNLTLYNLRTDSLSNKESNTYHELNRLSKKYNVEPKISFLRSLSSGVLPIGFFNFDIFNLVSNNMYESFRYQVGGRTNWKLSNNFSIGGYIAKGTKDKDTKGGGEVTFYINKKKGGELTLKLETDVLPVGRTKIKYQTAKDILEAKPNNIYNDKYFSYRTIDLSYQQNFFKNIDFTFLLNYQKQRVDFDYKFKNYNVDTWFNFVTTSVMMRYAPNVKYIESISGKRTTLKDIPPYYYLTYSKSWNLFNNSTATHRIYLSTLYILNTRLGSTEILGNMGASFGETPLMNTYEGVGVAKGGRSLWGRFSVKGYQSFETMEPSTFFSDKFASIQLLHHLPSIRLNQSKSLYFTLVYKGLIGGMSHKEDHQLFVFEVPKDYYQEIGIEANKLFLGFLGVGVYSRIGAYKIGNLDRNLYIKLTLDL
ncbi:hypothetical protein ETU10_02685 [Apibacter muscae]|uniref:carboxypeptidase-like regulatory domain-containing protein n=1 Tax=Apibacter muscae TaxID=2509004 RepID=UPI0011AD108F|nr:carboxypeptidase-like regulatory domain-containing protein [Apibacter muscae]TWP24884.1 hypothetical protein ETU10_02685 [Apibacter muscae]